ncbi:SurA N-terminal domain-containing protein [Shewanella sp. NIFS-20-20]|uniref:SurA N-terminal domain-containing protein n=1 Tax=Shewanella sp. NIFS-20-20 TaxID=2853806 RepID=UPI001C463F49|nr:SurA N-terminal domain-containing protein [Shewanella sp. NIFS-20-20]MBV7315933.1 SurA N-terminal domain-containing protein [Shewanella sp. NIFS-20-20]
MLEKIREGSQGVIAKTILVLVILSFAFAGVSSYLGTSTEEPAATVNGQEITQAQLEQAFQSEKSRMEQQLGDMFAALSADDNYMNSLKQSVLDRLIGDVLLNQAADKLGLRVSDEQIKQAIVAETAFQTNGQFDNERYQAILRQLGYQPVQFSDMMRQDMTRNQLVRAVVGSEFVLAGETEQLAKLQGQTRNIRYQIIDATPFIADVTISDEQAKSYYDANQSQFISPELVSLDYVDLDLSDMAQTIPVTDAQAQTYYDEHNNDYQTAEKRLAAHILIDANQDNAEQKANDIYQELVAGADFADFADVAKQASDDQFSAANGGQLDWFEQGVMDPEFDTALFAISDTGGISPVVKSNFGYQIVKLLDIQPGQVEPFDAVKAEIVAKLQQDAATDEFYQLQQKLADVSYEVPDTLTEAASAINGQVQHTALFSRQNPPAGLDAPEVVKAAFSEQVLLSGLNSDVIEIAPNHVIVLRINKHQNAGTTPFSDVKADIIARLQQEQAVEQAKLSAQTLMTNIKNGDSDAELISREQLGRFAQDINPTIVTKAFQMAAPSGAVVVDSVALAQGYAVVVLDGINPATGITEDLLARLSEGLTSALSQSDYIGLVDTLKQGAEITYPVAE